MTLYMNQIMKKLISQVNEMICALRNGTLSSSMFYEKSLSPWRTAAVQQQYLGTLWRTNGASVLEKQTPHDATTSWYS